jgi:hypothetical protein
MLGHIGVFILGHTLHPRICIKHRALSYKKILKYVLSQGRAPIFLSHTHTHTHTDLVVPSSWLCYMATWFFNVGRVHEGSQLCIAEKVPEPRSYGQVVDGFCSASFPIGQGQNPVGTTDRAASTVCVLVVCQLGVLAVDEGDMVVGTCFDFDHSTSTYFLEQFLGEGPWARIGVLGENGEQEAIHCFGTRICHLHTSLTVNFPHCTNLSKQVLSWARISSYLS